MRIVLIALLTMMSCQSFSQVQRFTLDNGLNIVVKEDHRAPVAISMIWYNVGSADESGGTTGISHALEHLMFKGTSLYPQGVFSKKFESLGGQINAFTNNDYTAYFEKIAATHLATSFEMEADRMQHLVLNAEEFAKEMKVIQEERRLRTDDNPQALTFERFLATAHLASPYHHPVIGWMSDLEQMTVEDAAHWYQRYYGPNNATLVVVGDVTADEVKKLAEHYFGKINRISTPLRKTKQEPPQLGEKKVTVQVPAQIPLLLMGYTVPSVKSASQADANDPYTLEVIAGILDAGDSARLSKNLVRDKRVASSADVYYNLYARYQTQFLIYGSPSKTQSLDQLRDAILLEIERLKKETVSDTELQRVKTQIIAQKTFEMDSMFGQAMELGLLETIGLGWQASESYIDKINAVTPAQVQKTAQHYLNLNALTDGRLIPDVQSQGKP